MPPKTPRFLPPRDSDTDLPRSTPRFRANPSSTPTPTLRRTAPSFITPTQPDSVSSQQPQKHVHSAPPRFLPPPPPSSLSVTPARRERPKFTSAPGVHLVSDDLDVDADEEDVAADPESPIRKRARIAAVDDEENEEEIPVVERSAGNGDDIFSPTSSSGDDDSGSVRLLTRPHRNVNSPSYEDEDDTPFPSTTRAQNARSIRKSGGNDDDSILSSSQVSRAEVATEGTPPHTVTHRVRHNPADEDDGFPTPTHNRFIPFTTPGPFTSTEPHSQRPTLLSRLRAATPPGASIPHLQMLLMSPEKKRSKYVPGGLAATLANWIVESRNAFESRQRRQDVLRVRVTECFGKAVRGASVPVDSTVNDVEEKTDEVDAVLIGEVAVKPGDLVLIRWPWTEVETMRGKVRVAVFWSIENPVHEEESQEVEHEDGDQWYSEPASPSGPNTEDRDYQSPKATSGSQ